MKAVKWFGFALGGLIVLSVLVAGVSYVIAAARFSKVYHFPLVSVAASQDPRVIERGHHLATTVLRCVECHADDFGGKVMIDLPALVTVRGSNLTPGKGGRLREYSDGEIARLLRHGINNAGQEAIMMPSSAYTHLSIPDLVAVISYLRTLPPVDRELGRPTFRPVGYVLAAAGIFESAIELIDHTQPAPDPVTPAVNVAYGQYLGRAAGCAGCHKKDLTGGRLRGAPKSIPPPSNLTATAAKWSTEEFINFFHTGLRPDGRGVHKLMPWRAVGHSTDDELKAIHLWIKSVPYNPASPE